MLANRLQGEARRGEARQAAAAAAAILSGQHPFDHRLENTRMDGDPLRPHKLIQTGQRQIDNIGKGRRDTDEIRRGRYGLSVSRVNRVDVMKYWPIFISGPNTGLRFYY